jgi:hypothetical protein
MSHFQFTNPEEKEDYFVFPFAESKDRVIPIRRPEVEEIVLPSELRGLDEVSQNEATGVLRFLALKMARALYMTNFPEGYFWYDSVTGATDFDDFLEVATAILAALQVDIISTDDQGGIELLMYPRVEDLKEFFLQDFIPIWHYIHNANSELVEEYQYDFENEFDPNIDLSEKYGFGFFSDAKRIVNLDAVFNLEYQDDEPLVVAVTTDGPSDLQPTREFTTPLDRILQVIIGVLYFFNASGNRTTFFNRNLSFEEYEAKMHEYIKEFPDEEELAGEGFHENIHGHVLDHDLIPEAAVLQTLGIVDVAQREDDWYHVSLMPPENQAEVLNDLGFNDGDGDPLRYLDFAGPISLGIYEYSFFSPDEDDEDEDESA